MHPLYPVARGMIGQPVTAYHVSGTVHPGIMHAVSPQGIYLRQTRMIMANGRAVDVRSDFRRLQAHAEDTDAELAFSPLGFFAFGALTGLTLGALAAGPYYGGYGYYPGYYW